MIINQLQISLSGSLKIQYNFYLYLLKTCIQQLLNRISNHFLFRELEL